jgi:hypothetical protein
MGASAIQFGLNYLLIYNVCDTDWEISLYVVSIAAVVIAIAADIVAWQSWQRTRRRDGNATIALERSEFMAYGGVLLSGLFTVLIVMIGVTPIFLSPCG